MPPLDHVMVVVRDLDDAAARFAADSGLVAVPGGRHEGLGTANAIVPLGDDYIEIIAVVDTDEAAANPLGQFLAHRLTTRGEGIVGVCLRADDVRAVATRIESSIVPMSRALPDGGELRWEVTGMEGALRQGLPYFIGWALDAYHPARLAVEHPSGATGIEWVEIGAEPARVRQWVGGDEPQLRIVDGEAGPQRYAVTTTTGALILT